MATLPPAPTDDLVEALPDDLVEEFLRRLPREDPASLVRASLVCKRWRRILADHGFCRRLCEQEHHHHIQSPAMLGFFGRAYGYGPRPMTEANPLLFTPTSSFHAPTAGLISQLRRRYDVVIDARHGHVLLAGMGGLVDEPSTCRFAVWDPITGDLLELPRLPRRQTADFTWKAVVLCASISSTNSCDHLDCHRGPFLVVFAGTSAAEVYTYVYSSQAGGAWSHTASAARDATDRSTLFYQNEICRSAVAGNAVYFRLLNNVRVLKYDLSTHEISSVDLPSKVPARWRVAWPQILLTTTQFGGLGVARVDMPRIHLWSGEAGPDGVFRWVQQGECIRLGTVPDHPHHVPPLFVVDIVGLGAIILWAHNGIFSVDTESDQVTKLCDDNCASYSVPYLSFCIPAVGADFTGEGPSAGVSKGKKRKRKRKRKRKKVKLLNC